MTDSSHPLAIPPPPRHALPGEPTGGEAWLRDPSPTALAAIAVGLVVVVLASIVSAFATPRRPDLPPPIEGQAILASPPLPEQATEAPAASWSPPPVSLSSRSVLPTRTAAPTRPAAPTRQPASPKPSRSRSKPPVSVPASSARCRRHANGRCVHTAADRRRSSTSSTPGGRLSPSTGSTTRASASGTRCSSPGSPTGSRRTSVIPGWSPTSAAAGWCVSSRPGAPCVR